MKRKIHNFITALLIVGFIVSAILGCVLYAESSMMPQHSHTAKLAKCCEVGAMLSDMTHIVPVILTADGFLAAGLLIVVILLLLNLGQQKYLARLVSYFTVRNRSGGFNLFKPDILLFSSGIIHPKIY